MVDESTQREGTGRKTAIITGASSGIGREFCKQIDALGEVEEIWLIARRADRLEGTAAGLSAKTRVVAADLTTSEGMAVVETALVEMKPNVCYLVNASGFGKFGRYDEVTMDESLKMIDLNVKAVVQMTLLVLPYVARGGHLIEMGSSSAFQPLPNFNIYASTKAFIVHYTKALRVELKPRRITATAVSPCWVETEFISVADTGYDSHGPKKCKPICRAEDVVRRALKDAKKGKALSVYGAFAKMQHVMGKLAPSALAIACWMAMQKKR